jgi:GTP-binding protein
MKAAAEALSKIPVRDLEISEEDRFVPEEKRFTYTIREEEEGIFVVEGSFVDRLLLAVNVNDADSLRYFHKVLKNKGIIDELLQMGIQDGDIVRLNDFEFEFLL